MKAMCKDQCHACKVPDLESLNKALIQGESLQVLANRYGLTKSSLGRHKLRHLAQALAAVAGRRGEQHAEELFGLVVEMKANARRLMRKAERGKNYSAAIAAARELTRVVELSGRLQPPPPAAIPKGSRVRLEFTVRGATTRIVAAGEQPPIEISAVTLQLPASDQSAEPEAAREEEQVTPKTPPAKEAERFPRDLGGHPATDADKIANELEREPRRKWGVF